MSEEPLPRPSASPSGAGGDETVPLPSPPATHSDATVPMPAPPTDVPTATLRLEQAPRFVSGQRVLKRYALESVLGQGGMAIVWKAWDETLGENVALKFLPEAVTRDAVAVEELKEETRRARRLTHPNIVRIHDFVQDATLAAVSMEYVDGDTLAKRRLDQPGKLFSVATLAPYVAQLCAALGYAHGRAKLVHRDLKPANLLVTRDGQLKITDFGIARGLTEASARLTSRAGRTSGTVLYASPQQLMGEKPTEADDIYAVGATLYELLTGKPPFFRGDAHTLMMQVRERQPAPLAERRAELELKGEKIPAEWEKTILACLAKKAPERPSSAHEVAERLGLASAATLSAVPVEKPAPAVGEPAKGGRTDRRVKPLVAAGLAVAVVAVALGYFFWPENPTAALQAPAPVAAKSSDAVAATNAREFVIMIDPPEAAARVSVGANTEVPVEKGKAVFSNLADGDHELTVQAPGFQTLATQVTVKDGRGSAVARLMAEKGIFEITARPGTRITAVNGQGREVRLGVVGASGVLASGSLLTVGTYTLKLEHPDCVPLAQVKMELDGERVTKLTLGQISLPGELRIFSVPTGAEVRVNGQAAGVTPATLRDQLSELPLAVEVFARGYRRVAQSVTLKPGQVRTLDVITLVAEDGGVEFRFAMADFRFEQAKVLIDGKAAELGRVSPSAPVRIEGLEVGTRTVEISHPDYEPWRQPVAVHKQQTTAVEVTLVPKPAVLTLAVSGATEYTLVVNGREATVRGTEASLPVGEELALELRARGFMTAGRRLTLPANGREKWQVALEKQTHPDTGQPWENTLGMKFVPVPGTAVLFSIWDTRVQDYDRFVAATRREWPKPSFAQGPTHPAVNVSWEDAQAFCAWLTIQEQVTGRLRLAQKYRLPTDTEWSVAVELDERRGGTPQSKHRQIKNLYPWGTQWPPPRGAGNYGSRLKVDDFEKTSPAGSFAANKFGLYDMGGNVWQWCEDFFDGNSGARVLRGASFSNRDGGVLLSSHRSDGTAGHRYNDFGFRCVVVIVPAP